MNRGTVIPVSSEPVSPCADCARVSLLVTLAEIKLGTLGRVERAFGDALADALVGQYVPGPDGDGEYEPSHAEVVFGNTQNPFEVFILDVEFAVRLKPRPRRLTAAAKLIADAEFSDPFADET